MQQERKHGFQVPQIAHRGLERRIGALLPAVEGTSSNQPKGRHAQNCTCA